MEVSQDLTSRLESGTAGASDQEAPSRAEPVSEVTRNLFGRGFAYVVIWSLGLVSGVVVTPIISRLLGLGGFGRLVAAVTMGQVFVALAGLGMQAAIIRQYVEDEDDGPARGLLFSSIAMAFAVTALLGITGPLWASSLGFNGFHGVIQLIVLWVAPAAATQAALGLLRAQDRLGAFSVVSILQSVIAQALAVGLLFPFSQSPMTYGWGLVAGQFVAFGYAVVATRPRPGGLRDWPIIRAALRVGVPLVPQAIAVFILSAGDRIVIQRLLGPPAVGRYQIGYSVGSIILLLMASLNQSWEAGVLGVRDPKMRSEVISEARGKLLRIVSPAVLGITVTAPVVLELWAPGSFDPVSLTSVSALVALSAIPYAFYLSNVLWLLSVRKTGWLAGASMVCAAVNIALNVMLIPVLGIAGSALATTLSYGVQALISSWASSRNGILDRARFRVLIGPIGVGAIVLLTLLLPKHGAWLVPRMGLGTLCLLWLGFAIRSAATVATSTWDPSRRLWARMRAVT